MFPELEPPVLERTALLVLPPAEPGSVRILVGDVRARLRSLPAKSVHMVATSPPYYGLRSYGTEPQVWGGACCEHEHEWGEAERAPWANDVPGPNTGGKNVARNTTEAAGQTCTHVHRWEAEIPGDPRGGTGAGGKSADNGRNVLYARAAPRGQPCECGAWLGHLGLEPSLEMYVEHIVEVFREVRRVLRDDGSVWLNLGDSYSSHDPGGYRPGEFLNPDGRQGPKAQTGARNRAGNYRPSGVKPKSLMMVPARVAIALESDGWFLRAQAPWVKANAMPDSAEDRPGNAVEMVYLLSRAKRYFYDPEAVRVEGADPDRVRRNRRNTDWFFESWQGLVLDDDDAPLAFVVNPQPFPGAHFAVWPSKLVVPMVKASTSEKGVCFECRAPWERVVETIRGGPMTATIGWRPTCKHYVCTDGAWIGPATIPATVLDIFGGAGSTAIAASRLGRDTILIELSPEFSKLAADRIVADGGFTVDVQIEEVTPHG